MRPSKLRLPDSTETTARSPSSTAVGDLLRERPRVADAGRAAVADEVEAELLERLGQPGAVEVFGDDLRAGRQRGLHPRLAAQAARERVAREDPRADHHRRVRGVGAAGDRGDHDVAVVELEGLAVDASRCARCRCAAASPSPPAGSCGCASAGRRPRGRARRWRAGPRRGRTRRPPRPARRPARRRSARSRAAPRGRRPARSLSATRSCGRLGPARLGSTVAEVELDLSEKVGFSEFSSCHRPCSLA